ncbi:MAG: hypothetical protein JNK75_01160 [Betaproteobacteria bacterium]|nr:hypothetical protein [Betaproteobacteria bacterium]
MRIRRLQPLLLLCAIALVVHAGHARGANAAAPGCPDLTGTYRVQRTAWVDQFHLHVTGTMRPPMQERQFATFQQRSGGYTLIWHMPRAEVVARARAVADRDPTKYRHWLDMALRPPSLTSPGGSTEQHWFNQLAHLGPVFRVDAALPLKECERGWVRVETHGRDGKPDVEGGMSGTRDATLWLGRDKDGSLALQWVERRKAVLVAEARYTKEVAIPLDSKAHFDTWPAVPTPDLSPLREDELPPRERPKGQLLKCQLDPALESQFQARLQAFLPPQAVHVNATRGGGFYQGPFLPDGSCAPMPYYVTISARNAADMMKVEAFLKADPFFERMDSQRSEALPDGRLWTAFKMMIVPD